MRIIRPSEVDKFPEGNSLSAEELAQAYSLAKAAFTAEDLQRYTEQEEGIPMEDVLSELEEIQRQMDQRPP